MNRSYHWRGKWLSLLFLCLALCLFGCGSASQTSSGNTPTGTSTLRVGVRYRILKFGYLNENTGKYSGLEIDIAQELADRLGYSSIEFIAVTPEMRLEMLNSDAIDCVIACYSINEAQKEYVDFSPAYYEDASVIMVENSSLIRNVYDLLGHGYTLGTLEGSNTAEQLIGLLKDMGLTDGEPVSVREDGDLVVYDNFNIAYFENYTLMDELLEEGSIDAFCTDGCIANTYMEDDRNILDFTISTQDYGVATLKGSVLSDPIAVTIQAMLDDGTIAELIEKWE